MIPLVGGCTQLSGLHIHVLEKCQLKSSTDFGSADVPGRVVTVTAQSGKSGTEVSISYTSCKVVGNGSFGVVFAARMLGILMR